MKFTLRQLQVFIATAHHENVSRAAASLAMSQSAASGALRDMERLYDVQLFDRVGKRVRLSEFGRLLRPAAEALLEQARELEQELVTHRRAGLLRIGATLTIGDYLVADLVARYRREREGAQVTVTVANTAAISRQLLNFDLDVALIEGELQHPELELLPWRADELVVFCAPNHPWAGRDTPLSDAELLQQPWVLREAGSGTRQTFDRAMHGLLPDVQVALELQHTEAIKRAVMAGLGIACLSRITVQEEFRRGDLIELAVPQRDFSRQFYLALHRQKYRSVGLQQWLELCMAARSD